MLTVFCVLRSPLYWSLHSREGDSTSFISLAGRNMIQFSITFLSQGLWLSVQWLSSISRSQCRQEPWKTPVPQFSMELTLRWNIFPQQIQTALGLTCPLIQEQCCDAVFCREGKGLCLLVHAGRCQLWWFQLVGSAWPQTLGGMIRC